MENTFVWHEQYKAALLETDRAKLPQRIQVAKSAIDDRLQELLMDHGGTRNERQTAREACPWAGSEDALEGLARKGFI